MTEWVGHAHAILASGGYRVSAPRAAVVATLDELGCSVTAQEIADRLRQRGEGVGVASIYRALQLLDDMSLVRRVDVGEAVARYEPVHPSGEHHHHLVCESCGETKAFEDPELERAIERLAGRVDYSVGEHDVTLRGTCPACSTSA
ncbi:MAG TPA: Fur family transcriptional regulator [Thermoleophilaceae bacterium]|jgi:Fur family ferric uptake transcriptional regulator|nr:Fur family transcriptional regulator [Thermoleophilaceae bacterium]